MMRDIFALLLYQLLLFITTVIHYYYKMLTAIIHSGICVWCGVCRCSNALSVHNLLNYIFYYGYLHFVTLCVQVHCVTYFFIAAV